MSLPASPPLDLNALPPAVREAFLAMRAEVVGLRAQTERRDYLIAELRHALYAKRSEQLNPDDRQMAFEDLGLRVSVIPASSDSSQAFIVATQADR